MNYPANKETKYDPAKVVRAMHQGAILVHTHRPRMWSLMRGDGSTETIDNYSGSQVVGRMDKLNLKPGRISKGVYTYRMPSDASLYYNEQFAQFMGEGEDPMPYFMLPNTRLTAHIIEPNEDSKWKVRVSDGNILVEEFEYMYKRDLVHDMSVANIKIV